MRCITQCAQPPAAVVPLLPAFSTVVVPNDAAGAAGNESARAARRLGWRGDNEGPQWPIRRAVSMKKPMSATTRTYRRGRQNSACASFSLQNLSWDAVRGAKGIPRARVRARRENSNEKCPREYRSGRWQPTVITNLRLESGFCYRGWQQASAGAELSTTQQQPVCISSRFRSRLTVSACPAQCVTVLTSVCTVSSASGARR
jgi:hypothetical protein